MFIEDKEMNYNQGKEPSTIELEIVPPLKKMAFYNEDMIGIQEISKIVDSSESASDVREMQSLELTERPEIQAHEKGKDLDLLKTVYTLIKLDNSASAWRSGNDILLQKSPMGNTVLHIAALYGNDYWMEKLAQNASHLLAVKNDNDDTALHVAARAGNISTLQKLLAAILRNLPFPYSENPKEALVEILVKNRQGNTFFHEVLLNGHRGVMSILTSQKQIEDGFLELVERAAFFWTNNEQKSVLHLAIEEGYKEIVDHALTKLISPHPALNKLIENHPELAEMIPHGIPQGKSALLEQDQGREIKNQLQDSISMDTSTHCLPHQPHLSMASTSSEIMNCDDQVLKSVVKKLAFVDLEIMKENLENLSSENEKCQELNQDSTPEKLIENHQKLAQLIPYGPHYIPPGKSPLIVAILKQDQDILQIILTKKKEWIHLKDSEGWTALHYAASIGYLNGVEDLLKNCISCNMERDNYGFFPLHLASAGGHAEVVKKLLEHCPDPREILDNYGRNIVHIAAENGKLNVIRYILLHPNHGFVKMINDKDANGNTPLHLATLYCHPKIVYALTWDKRVDLSLVNKNNQTALDAYMQFQQENPPLQQRLTWIALKSAGVQYARKGPRSHSIKVPLPPHSAESVSKQKAPSMDLYKDRINTLMLVSTLITTVTFAAGFTLPGGTNSSSPGQGMALMLNHVWFKPFIFCITVSMYGAISVTIILIWAQLGDITLALLALKVAMPLLGVTLATLSVAFLAGVHLVISDLSWLATTIMVICVIFILMLLLLYTLLFFPSSSSNLVIRYISYYPFLFLTWLVEQDETKGM
ncbi:hypothetical protein VNO77_27588 [Canavalia gladiata]|uniref:PGG domain-containing protein n=1 Tax=Canavalia gladiata TaxID=3824 RepID=A0AAN9KY46_CANGL